MFLIRIIKSLIYSLIRDIKNMIGTLAILIFLYFGFFGSKTFCIKPFILEWLIKTETKELIKKTVDKY